jgi:excisionase family DNA binding protein
MSGYCVTHCRDTAMNKEEAAAYLGISTRTLERYSKDGKLQVKYEGAKTRPIATYDPDDLDQLKAELETPTIKPTVSDAALTPTVPDTERGEMSGIVGVLMRLTNPIERLIDTLDRRASLESKPHVPIADKLLLTMPEAQALTGLSREILKEAIDAGNLPTKRMGKAYRFKRKDIEQYIERLWETDN